MKVILFGPRDGSTAQPSRCERLSAAFGRLLLGGVVGVPASWRRSCAAAAAAVAVAKALSRRSFESHPLAGVPLVSGFPPREGRSGSGHRETRGAFIPLRPFVWCRGFFFFCQKQFNCCHRRGSLSFHYELPAVNKASNEFIWETLWNDLTLWQCWSALILFWVLKWWTESWLSVPGCWYKWTLLLLLTLFWAVTQCNLNPNATSQHCLIVCFHSGTNSVFTLFAFDLQKETPSSVIRLSVDVCLTNTRLRVMLQYIKTDTTLNIQDELCKNLMD